ncbi:MAG: hypothetical protein LBB45_00010 [Methanobrevibacter sp.]|jgi:hypothetical protein|nr:hypothetical protein [Candidatus Methanovirga basalitermitum]
MKRMFLFLIGGVSDLSYSTVMKDSNLSIQEMIDVAAQVRTINLDNRVYTGENNCSITINKSITINDDGAVINAQQMGRIFTIGNNSNVSLNNMKIVNGEVTGETTGYGGVIFNYGAVLTINN